MRRAKAKGFNKASFINIINKHSYHNIYKTIDCFREISSKQILHCIWKFISLIPDKQPFNLCIIEFTLMHGISWVYLQLLEAVELLNLFLTTTGKKYTFTAQLSLMLSEKKHKMPDELHFCNLSGIFNFNKFIRI